MGSHSVIAGLQEGKKAPPRVFETEILDTPAALLAEEYAAAWQRGERPPVERFLAERAPHDSDPEVIVRLVYEEMCLRRESGNEMTPDEVLHRFPQFQSELQLLLDCERLLGESAPANFPETGEEIGPFRLLSELGRGALGRVYLAVQPALSDRPVVVKVTPQVGQEHLSLARLQHTAIVPLYFAQNFPDRHLRLLCMPYLGGVTLAQLCERLAKGRPGTFRGRDLASLLQGASSLDAAPISHRGPALQFLERASYLQAVTWIGACLADALHYAHERGLAHFDVKPSNVLLAGDGQPMLLDFHLARGPLRSGDCEEWLGGTPGYMSPEQEAALTALRDARPISGAVDHRSDIYALGRILEELLRHAGEQRAPRLREIVRKCCAAAPERRYQDAAALALDLRRSLADSTLDGNAGSPGFEHGPRWRSRAVLATLIALSLGAAISAASLSWRLRRAETALAKAHAAVNEQTKRDRSQRLAGNLRQVVDRLRWLSAKDSLDLQAAKSVDATCRQIWEHRVQFLGEAGRENESSGLRDDLAEMAVLWAEARVALASQGRKDQALADAIESLATAERELGNQPVLSFAGQRLGAQRSGIPLKQLPTLRTAREHGLVGRLLLHDGRTAEALEHLRRGAAQSPGDFWVQFSLGQAAERFGQTEEAIAAYSASIALAPERPECRWRRAAVYQKSGRNELASLDEARARQISGEKNRPETLLPR